MKSSLAIAVGLLALADATPARALDKAACLDAAGQGQSLRDAHRLVEAQKQFRTCSQQECPGVVQKDCAAWLEAVDRSIPTVVLSAKSSAGSDLFDVAVTVDGRAFATRLEGEAVAVDPGRHTFHFQLADGTQAEQTVLVREGEKNQSVQVVLGNSAVTSEPRSATPGTATEPKPSGSSPVRTAGWIVGGVGLAAVAVGAVFGVLAIEDKSSGNCVGSSCSNISRIDDARKVAAPISDAGLFGGAALVATGVLMVVLAPHGHAEAARASAWQWSPTLAHDGAGLVLSRGF